MLAPPSRRRLALPALVAGLCALIGPFALAGPFTPVGLGLKVALVPLDSRPATSDLPVRVAGLAGVEVLSPPRAVLGTATREADPNRLEAWLEASNADRLVVSLDAFAYGGLVQSRSSSLSADAAWDRLAPVRRWREATGRPVWAFVTIPRHPDARDRPRNLALVRRGLDLAADGTLEELAVTWDDALPGSPAPLEGETIRAEAAARGLTNVLVYPGADEVASTMLARLALRAGGAAPRVAVAYSQPERRGEVVRYDGLPLEASVRAQARAVGLEVVEPGQADFTLYVHNGGDGRAAALEVLALERAGPVAVADIKAVNTADGALVSDLVTAGGFLDLYGFAAWGTPGNNLGTALAQGAARALGGESAAARALLVREYVNDYLYSSLVRPEVRRAWKEPELGSAPATANLLERLRRVFGPARFPGADRAWLAAAEFPWSRSFEVGLEIGFTPLGPCPARGPCLLP